MKRVLTACAIWALASLASAAPLTLTGADGKSITLSDAEFAALPREKITFDIHGAKATYEGPALTTILAKAGAPTGEALRGAALAQVALIKAADGYAVALSLGETDPALHDTQIILADKADGKSLAAEDGPYRLIVGGDKRPARSARQVVAIEIKALAAGKPPAAMAH